MFLLSWGLSVTVGLGGRKGRVGRGGSVKSSVVTGWTVGVFVERVVVMMGSSGMMVSSVTGSVS